MATTNSNMIKFVFSVIGAAYAYFKPSLWIILVGLLFIIVDNITGWYANKRVKKKYPCKVKTAKFQSRKAEKTLRKIFFYIVFVLMSFIIETQLIKEFTNFKLTAMLATIYCIVEAISILENYSTANDSDDKFVVILRKYLVDKSERYFNVDIDNDGKIGKGDKE